MVFRAPKPKVPDASVEGITVRADGVEEISASVEASPVTAPIPESPPDVLHVPVTGEEPVPPHDPSAESDLGIKPPEELTPVVSIDSPEGREDEGTLSAGDASEKPDAAIHRDAESPSMPVEEAGDRAEERDGISAEDSAEDTAGDTADIEPQKGPEEEAGDEEIHEEDWPVEPSPEPEPPSEANVEDQVEERIAAFEETLAMQCPLCREASVEENETAKGPRLLQVYERSVHVHQLGPASSYALPPVRQPVPCGSDLGKR